MKRAPILMVLALLAGGCGASAEPTVGDMVAPTSTAKVEHPPAEDAGDEAATIGVENPEAGADSAPDSGAVAPDSGAAAPEASAPAPDSGVAPDAPMASPDAASEVPPFYYVPGFACYANGYCQEPPANTYSCCQASVLQCARDMEDDSLCVGGDGKLHPTYVAYRCAAAQTTGGCGRVPGPKPSVFCYLDGDLCSAATPTGQ